MYIYVDITNTRFNIKQKYGVNFLIVKQYYK